MDCEGGAGLALAMFSKWDLSEDTGFWSRKVSLAIHNTWRRGYTIDAPPTLSLLDSAMLPCYANHETDCEGTVNPARIRGLVESCGYGSRSPDIVDWNRKL